MFNISEFKARIDRHGGLARTNLFEVQFASQNIPDIITSDDLRFFCQTVTMPGINIETMQYKPTGLGYSEFMPMNSSPEQLNAIFMLDSNHRVMTFFHRWISSIVNINGSSGQSQRGLGAKLIEYKDNYTTRMTIKYYSTHNPFQFYECTYDGVYPTQVSSTDLNWASNDSPATLTVNFSYNRMLYSGFTNNSTIDRGSQDSIVRGDIPQFISDFDQRSVDAAVFALND